jgi:hypothetical protein
MSFTNYLENAVLGHVFGGSTLTKPSVFVGLFTAAPGEAGGGTEVTGGSYARQAWSGTVSGTAPTQAANTAAIEFPTASANWGSVTHAAWFDASTAGNMLAYGTLGTARTVNSGDAFRFAAGAAVVTLE